MTTTAPTPTDAGARTAPLRLAVLALAMGGFAIGTTEFVTMGLLPADRRAASTSRSRSAGHVISAYAARGGRRRAGAGVLRRQAAAAWRCCVALMAAYAVVQRGQRAGDRPTSS